ncbi:MAG: tetratricopeptide repeat protein [Vicinamibacterales bacterium]
MTDVSLNDWDDVGELVERALELPETDRVRWLEAQCGADPARLASARRVLAAAQRVGAFLDRPAVELASDLMQAAASGPTHPPGYTVGAYRLIQPIGRGGMADVYLAARADDEFTREVAVKIVREGLGGDLLHRFRVERQVLATVDHPHIARLFDGGVTDDGRPYLVMEFVQGQPIDRHADARRLTVDLRLALFLQVCDAVDRAHRHLVVHRDLKPANILVTAEGAVKLLDFGVAKLLEKGDGGGDAPATRSGARLMTPEYASPEQYLGEPVTTAADVYAAGVVLYELLTGRRPWEEDEASLAALERRVLDGTVEPPSQACRRDGPRGPAAARAAARATTVDALARELAGDLDNIVTTALRREPHRRYASVAAFRDDIERYRGGLPVAARPATMRYRASKFLRRHRLAVAAGVLAVLTAAAGGATALVQARAAAREGRRAAEIRDFLLSVFEVSDPDRARGQAVTARELLDRGSDRVERSLTADPGLQAEMRGVLGGLYARLGLYDRAAPHMEAAVAAARAQVSDPATLADRLTALGRVRARQDDGDTAERQFQEALRLARAAEGPRGGRVADALSGLAEVRRLRAAYAEGEGLLREALAIRREQGDVPGLVDTLNALGLLLTTAKRPLDAEPAFDEALALARATYGDLHTDVVRTECNLAEARHQATQYAEALALFTRCVAGRRQLLGDRHPDVGDALNNMAQVHVQMNQYEAAEQEYVEALAILRAAFGEAHHAVAATLNNYAVLEYMRSRYDEAADRFRELAGVFGATVGPDHPDTWATTNNLAMALQAAGRLDEAERVLRDVVAARQRIYGPDHAETAEAISNLGQVLLRQKRYAEARRLADTALGAFERAYPDGHVMVGITLVARGRAELGLGRAAEALASFDRAMAVRAAQFGETHLQTAEARIGRGRALAALGRVAEGRREVETALAHLAAAGRDDSRTAQEGRAALEALPE